MKKVLLTTIVIVVIALVFLVRNGIQVEVPYPAEQRLTTCNSNLLQFSMRCEESPPYQLLIAVPQSTSGDFRFRGEITISHGTGVVARVPISSDTITPCNWLDDQKDVTGYILTWARTNRGERLEELLSQGQTYQLRVDFAEMPPGDSSLWLSFMKR